MTKNPNDHPKSIEDVTRPVIVDREAADRLVTQSKLASVLATVGALLSKQWEISRLLTNDDKEAAAIAVEEMGGAFVEFISELRDLVSTTEIKS